MGGAPLRLSGCVCLGMRVGSSVGRESCLDHTLNLTLSSSAGPRPSQIGAATLQHAYCRNAFRDGILIKGDHMDGSARRPRGRWIMGDSQQNSATPQKNADFSVPGKLAVSAIPVTPTYPATPTAPQQAQPPSTSNPTRLNHRSPLSSPATAKRNRFRFCSSASTN